MPKFFVKDNQIKDNKIKITGEDVNHISNVLRMRKEDELQICNQDTAENYMAKILTSSKEYVECQILEKINYTLAVLTPRKIDNGNSIKFQNKYYQPYLNNELKCFSPKEYRNWHKGNNTSYYG